MNNKIKMTKSREELSRRVITDLKPYDPERIIIFGSYSRGEEKRDSDLDVLIIKKTRQKRFERIKRVLDLLYPVQRLGKNYYSMAIDPHVYTPEEVRNRFNMGDFFIHRILGEGKVIYEK